MSAAVGSSSIARLYAAMAAASSSSFSSRWWPSRNCAYASATLSGEAVVGAGRWPRGRALRAGARVRRSEIDTLTAATRTATFIHFELFHKSGKVSYIRSMAVDPELLEILACPNCKTPVTLVKNGAALKCGTCKRVYPIKDDIPVMLIDEATIETD